MDDRAGSRNTIVMVERAADTRVNGIPTEIWSPVFSLWAEVQTRQSDQWSRLGIEVSKKALSLKFAWADGQHITEFMRLRLGGKAFDIRSIDYDEDLKRQVTVLAVETEANPMKAIEEWRQEMRRGEIVLIRREAFEGNDVNRYARAIVSGFDAQELVGGIDLASRKVIVFTADVEDILPLQKGDLVIINPEKPTERSLTAVEIDINTHQVAGVIPVIEITATGP